MAINMDTGMVRAPGSDIQLHAGQRRLRVVRALAIGIGATVLACAVGLLTFAGVVRTRAPASLPAIWYDPIAAMADWSNTLAADPVRVRDNRTRDVAIAALDAQPLNAQALWLLATWENTRHRPDSANHLAKLSEKVSRRYLLTQLYLLEQAVTRDDINGALTHYDKALRVSPDSKELLFPVLTSAMATPSIRDGLALYVRQNAPWMGGFLFAALDTQDGASSAAKLLLDPKVPADNPLLAQLSHILLTRLVDQRQFALAERVLLKRHSGRSAMLRDLSFSERLTDPANGPFSWHITDNADVSVTFERTERTGMHLYLALPSGAIQNPMLIWRIVHLAPGEYRFTEVRQKNSTSSELFWQVECISSNTGPSLLWSSGIEARMKKVAPLRIPSGCTWQKLSLLAADTVNAGGGEIAIERITIERLERPSFRSESRPTNTPVAGRSKRRPGT